MKNTFRNWIWTPGMRQTALSVALALAAVLVLAVMTAGLARAQTYTALASFDGAKR